MRSTVRNASTYFEQLDDERREPLLLLRKLIKTIWPDVVEDMDREMPTYHLNGHAFCALSSQKHFMALYIVPYDLLRAFKKDLMIYNTGQSCIRFKRLDPSTYDLFDQIIKYTGSQLTESEVIGIRKERRPVRA